MQKTSNKHIYIAIGLLIMIIITSIIIFTRQGKREVSQPNAENEAKYSQTIASDISKKPFLSSLPIKTNYYTVIYSSLNEKIIVIFKNRNEQVDDLKSIYQEDIVGRLRTISVDESTISNISWEKEKN